MRNNFLSSSLNSVVSLDMESSWAARSWDSAGWSPHTYQVPSPVIYNTYMDQQVPYKKWSPRETVTETDSYWPGSLSQGKVRQLFQERRGGKGWDRSYPLEPLKSKRSTQEQTKSLSNLTESPPPPAENLPADRLYFYTKLPNLGTRMQRVGSGTGSPAGPGSAPLKKPASRIPQPAGLSERIKSPSAPLSRDLRKPVLTPKKPPNDDFDVKPRSTEVKRISPLLKKEEERPRIQKTANEVKNSPSQTPTLNKVRTPLSSPPKTERTASSSNSTPEKVRPRPTPNPDLAQCSVCGRNFLPDRLALHEKICKKSKTKKRKVFDPVKHRVAGTEAESYVKKGTAQSKPAPQAPKSDWRKKHEEFIANIRAAKQVKEHLAKGGKLSDLPPPPPLDTSDYVQCPHCGRKFNSGAAERHIPICANMKHNKPKKTNKK